MENQVIIKKENNVIVITPIRCGVHDNICASKQYSKHAKAYRLFLKLDYEGYKNFCDITEEIANPYEIYAIEGEYYPQEKRAWIKEIHGYVECEGTLDYYEDLYYDSYYQDMEII